MIKEIKEIIQKEFKNNLDSARIFAYVDNLEKQNKFLMERENKLQLIENMFKNEPIDLKELSKLVRGE